MALLLEGIAQIVVGLGEVRLEPDGGATGGDGLVQLALLSERIAEIAVGLGEVGLELDGGAVGGDGLVQLAFVLQGSCPGCCGPRRSRA